jgi:hypothetical protein
VPRSQGGKVAWEDVIGKEVAGDNGTGKRDAGADFTGDNVYFAIGG